MTEHWINEYPTVSGSHRLNVATFLAKLASTRAGKDKLFQIALILFRDLFEERQELRSGEVTDDEDPKRAMGQLEMFQLLPSAVAWFFHAGTNLILLSELDWSDCPSAIAQGGPKFIESELGQRSPTGFSPWRYTYWLKRLHEIQEEAKEANEERLVEHTSDVIDYIIGKVEERNSEILKAYKNGGDTLRQDKHLFCLKDLLTENTKNEAENDELKGDAE